MPLSCPSCENVFDDELPRLAEAANVICPQCGEPVTLPEMTMPIDITGTPLEIADAGIDGGKKYALLVVSGPEAGKVLDVEKPTISIGRAECDLMLDDAEISRRHAVVEISGTEATIRDLDSTNGTFVGEERIGQASLKNSEKFRVGSHEIALVITDRD